MKSNMAIDRLDSVPFKSSEVAIAVSHSSFGGGHIGLGYFHAKEGPKVLHLAWHRDLKNDRIPDDLLTCWGALPLPLPPLASKQVVAFVRSVAAKGPSINYGIDFVAAKGAFNTNGSYKPPRGSDGLTCATFVLEILRACSVDLLKTQTWEASEENIDWGNRVCAELAKKDPEHAGAVKQNVTGLRVRPYEVAAAAQCNRSSWAMDFHAVQEPSKVLITSLNALCSAPTVLVG